MIYFTTLFFCENLITKINAYENPQISEFHLSEFNRTFQNTVKNYCFDESMLGKNIVYHKVDISKKNLPMNIYGRIYGKISSNVYKHGIISLPQWYNEGLQRDIAQSVLTPLDDDIVIVSDIDEIIMSDYLDELISETKKRGIITIKLYFTLFFFNLVSKNWGGPDDYSYRLFMMTGKKYKEFKEKKFGFDILRKDGEHGKLINEIYCFPEIAGYHHSWLGDEEFIEKKLKSYAHITEHNGRTSKEFIKSCLNEGKSLFPDHELEVRNDLKLLKYVNENKAELSNYFISL